MAAPRRRTVQGRGRHPPFFAAGLSVSASKSAQAPTLNPKTPSRKPSHKAMALVATEEMGAAPSRSSQIVGSSTALLAPLCKGGLRFCGFILGWLGFAADLDSCLGSLVADLEVQGCG